MESGGIIPATPSLPAQRGAVSERERAIVSLHALGCRFVTLAFIGGEWRPAWKGWLEYHRPGVRTVLDYDARPEGQLGFVPWSLGLSGLDVDEWTWEELQALQRDWPPVTALKTESGWHLMYSDWEPRGNVQQWTAYGLRGQVRGAVGLLRFHSTTGMVKLNWAIRHEPLSRRLWNPAWSVKEEAAAAEPRPQPERERRSGGSSLARDAAFDRVRLEAYGKYRETGWRDFEGFLSWALKEAAADNLAHGGKLSHREVVQQATSIAVFCRDRLGRSPRGADGKPDYSSETQGKRAIVRGVRHRAKEAKRNAAIKCLALHQGWKQERIAAQFDLSQMTISRIVRAAYPAIGHQYHTCYDPAKPIDS